MAEENVQHKNNKDTGSDPRAFYIFKIVFISLFILLVLSYFIQKVYSKYYSPVKTQTAMSRTVKINTAIEAFAVRSEINISFSASGTFVPLLDNGDKAAANENIIAVYSSPAAASGLSEKHRLEQQISYYERFEHSGAVNSSDISGLDRTIYSACNVLLNCADTGELRELSSLCTELNTHITRRQISTGKQIDVSSVLRDLKSQLAALDTNDEAREYVSSPASGYYVSSRDGYEGICDYGSVNELNVDDIRELFKSKPETVSADHGKIIDNFRWYLVMVADEDQLIGIEIGDKLTVGFTKTGAPDTDFTVCAVNGPATGQRAIVLYTVSMDQELLSVRHETVRVREKTVNGIVISKNAIDRENGLMGVYTLLGNTVKFRCITPLYSTKDIVIVENAPSSKREIVTKADGSEKSYYYVKLYDRVIVKGRKLYDGKIIK